MIGKPFCSPEIVPIKNLRETANMVHQKICSLDTAHTMGIAVPKAYMGWQINDSVLRIRVS